MEGGGHRTLWPSSQTETLNGHNGVHGGPAVPRCAPFLCRVPLCTARRRRRRTVADGGGRWRTAGLPQPGVAGGDEQGRAHGRGDDSTYAWWQGTLQQANDAVGYEERAGRRGTRTRLLRAPCRASRPGGTGGQQQDPVGGQRHESRQQREASTRDGQGSAARHDAVANRRRSEPGARAPRATSPVGRATGRRTGRRLA